VPYVDHKTSLKSTSLKLFGSPASYRIRGPSSSLLLLKKRLKGFYPALEKCRLQGLATLWAVLALQSLESLFQLSTLLSFPLQSFAPFK
jgi:hypothetical protein